MNDLRLVQISGSHAAGKDRLMLEVFRVFEDLVRAIPWTTRAPRPGEKNGVTYYFVSEEERMRADSAGEFINMQPIRSHYSGLYRNELLRAERMLLDITPAGARRVRDAVLQAGGRTFCIYVYAPEYQRRARIVRRDPRLEQMPEEVDRMITGDPVSSDPGDHQDFDLLVSNGDGEFEVALMRITQAIEVFLGS